MDTETTGLGTRDEIIQLAVINLDGSVLFDQKIKPTSKKTISPEASKIHGIKMKDLEECPTFKVLKKPLKKAIGRKTIITYNAEFDKKMYFRTYQLAGGFLPKGNWECAMLEYAKYAGEWNEYYKDYKWQKLEGGDHTAVGDCIATLDLIKSMANSIKLKRWYEFWIRK
ncbi:3'-5' exonuclease [Gimesia aquarii]|nr:3'-5' exonuclease [Gimesia aquarii]